MIRQDSESRLRAVLATAPDGVITISSKGIILDANLSTERIFRWPRDELIGRNVRDLMGEPDRSRHDGYLQHYLATGEARIIGTGREVVGRRRDGTPVPIRLAIGHARYEGEDLFVGFVSDISDRRAMEDALRNSEQRLRALISNTPGVAYSRKAGPNGCVDFISDAIERVSGYPPGDFTGPAPARRYADLLHPADRERVCAEIAEAVELGAPYSAEYRMLHRSGEMRWMWESGRTESDAAGNTPTLHGLILDVTDRREAALEIERYRAIIASSDDAIISMTLDNVITSWNRGAETMFGWTAAQAIGQPITILRWEECASADNDRVALILEGQLGLHFETLRRHKDGHAVNVQVTLSPIHDDEGRVVGVSKFLRDISERLAMERDLREAKERAEQAAEARSAFLANMSHEIRTPMNAIIGFTDVLLDGAQDPVQRRHLGTIRGAATALMRLLNEVLDTAKLDRGAVELEIAPFDMVHMLEELTAPYAAGSTSRGLRFALAYESELPRWVLGDALRLRQILSNLLDNAQKFTSEGRIQLAVSAAGDGRMRFSVTDTGIGIAPDRLAAIFDPFTQADASMTRRFGGTGLGTTISKQLVELMGGRITAESTPGVGSIFSFEIALPGAEPPAAPAAVPVVQLPPLRILVVDDVPQNLELADLVLSAAGHAVTIAPGGRRALKLATTQTFDVILMDVHMPELDGLETARLLRAAELHDGRPHVPVIALTASVLERDREQARLAGLDGFASKPMDRGALYMEIARVLGLAVGDALPVPRAPTPEALARATGLARWGQARRTYATALRRFAEEHRGLATALRGLRDDPPRLQAAAHRAGGVAGNLALEALHQRLLHLEQAAMDGDACVIQIDLDEIQPDLDAALSAIAAFLCDQDPADDAAPHEAEVSLEQALAFIDTLMASLQRGALNQEALTRLTAAMHGRSLSDEVGSVTRAIEQFDFPLAADRLATLKETLSGVTELSA